MQANIQKISIFQLFAYLSPQFKYMIFHMFTSILHHLRVYYELTTWLAPSWLDSAVGGALHRHRRSHGFESLSSLNFFQALISQLLKLCDCDDQSCLHIFLRSSDKWYFVYSLASKVNCHKTSQHGNNRTNVWIETQKLKTLKN